MGAKRAHGYSPKFSLPRKKHSALLTPTLPRLLRRVPVAHQKYSPQHNPEFLLLHSMDMGLASYYVWLSVFLVYLGFLQPPPTPPLASRSASPHSPDTFPHSGCTLRSRLSSPSRRPTRVSARNHPPIPPRAAAAGIRRSRPLLPAGRFPRWNAVALPGCSRRSPTLKKATWFVIFASGLSRMSMEVLTPANRAGTRPQEARPRRRDNLPPASCEAACRRSGSGR